MCAEALTITYLILDGDGTLLNQIEMSAGYKAYQVKRMVVKALGRDDITLLDKTKLPRDLNGEAVMPGDRVILVSRRRYSKGLERGVVCKVSEKCAYVQRGKTATYPGWQTRVKKFILDKSPAPITVVPYPNVEAGV